MLLPVCSQIYLPFSHSTQPIVTDDINLSVFEPAVLANILDGMEELEAAPPVIPQKRDENHLTQRQGPTPNNIIDSHSRSRF